MFYDERELDDAGDDLFLSVTHRLVSVLSVSEEAPKECLDGLEAVSLVSVC